MRPNRYHKTEVSGFSASRIGRPKRNTHAYDYRRVPVDYAIPPAFRAWVSPRKP